jgi:fatty acid desaturase
MFLVVGTILTLVGGWSYFLLFWVLPLLTIFMAIVRWGAICEHVYGPEGVSVEESSPVIIPTLLNKILLPNLNFAIHPYHHHFAGVSFGNLPALHQVFVDEGMVHQPMVFHGQGEYLRYLLTGSKVPAKATSAEAATA